MKANPGTAPARLRACNPPGAVKQKAAERAASAKAPERSRKTSAIRATLIAPCGMNCRLCIAYSRDRNACPGCCGDDSVKPKTRVTCRIKTCEKIVQGRIRYCFGCDSFPCAGLNHLDKRYRARYGMSMIENLEKIRKHGMRQFIREEKVRWTCPGCGGTLCVHKPGCLSCDYRWR
jgi:hypothetical protein